MKKHVILLVQEAIRINSISTLNRFFFLYKFFLRTQSCRQSGSGQMRGKKRRLPPEGGGAVFCEAGAPASDEEGLAIFGGAAETDRTVSRDPKGFKCISEWLIRTGCEGREQV